MEVKNKNLLSFLFVSLLIYTIIAFFIYSYNPFKFSEKFDMPMNIILILLGFIFLTVFIFFQLKLSDFKDYKKFFKILGSFIIILLALIFMIYFIIIIIQNPTMNNIFSIITRIIEISIFILTLTFIFKLLESSLTKIDQQYPNIGLLINLILYIPCLVGDFIDFFKQQYNITTKTTWIIFFTQLILVGLYILIPIIKNVYNKQFLPLIKNNFPKLYHNYFESQYTYLQIDPIYTNNEKILGTFQNLNLSDSKNFNYNYGIYFDLWINPQPPSTNPSYSRETNILNYGNKLIISYKDNKLLFKALNNKGNYETVFVEKQFIYQRWNNIAVNYFGGTVDVFINNELVGTLSNIVPYMKVDKVISGKNNGIYGGVKNILYSDKPLSLSNINNLSFSL